MKKNSKDQINKTNKQIQTKKNKGRKREKNLYSFKAQTKS
jgi:hypothetical protein